MATHTPRRGADPLRRRGAGQRVALRRPDRRRAAVGFSARGEPARPGSSHCSVDCPPSNPAVPTWGLAMNTQPGIDSIFCAALEIASPEERAAYLDRACGGDQQLRGRVEELLAAHALAGSFLAPSAAESADTSDVPPPT